MKINYFMAGRVWLLVFFAPIWIPELLLFVIVKFLSGVFEAMSEAMETAIDWTFNEMKKMADKIFPN